jgi:hypothetical protein
MDVPIEPIMEEFVRDMAQRSRHASTKEVKIKPIREELYHSWR